MRTIIRFDEIQLTDEPLVGGKGLSLGRMARAGLSVPPGFCVSTTAYRAFGQLPLDPGSDLGSSVVAAYHALGSGLVAVRSSATGEDGAEMSFAGQQETFLGIDGDAALCEAIARCWASLRTERAIAYRRKQGIAEEGLAMAVVVQRLVPAETAGVIFTHDPLDATGQRLLIEASWGLGESVVSGRVQPDRFHLDRATGAVRERHIGHKTSQVTARGTEPVPAEMQDRPCLDDAHLAELAELARRVESVYQEPRDIEWARESGRLWLLQARPITTADAAEREQVRQDEIATLRKIAEPAGTVWSRYNLSEILPEPTPMTWAIVRRFMSGQGGFGLMYRDLGFDPDPSLDEAGVFDLVAGRPFCNLSREARMHFRSMPFEHNFTALKADPAKALYPTPGLNPGRLGCLGLLLFPFRLFGVLGQQVRAQRTQTELIASFAAKFRTEIVPAFLQRCTSEEATALESLDDAALIARLEQWFRVTLIDFARESLKPTALAALALATLQAQLLPWLQQRAEASARELVGGVHPDPEANLPQGIEQLANGTLDRAAFLARFGHRGPGEMELAKPRWREDPAAVDRLARGRRSTSATPESTDAILARWAREKPLADAQATAIRSALASVQTFLALRETAKHHLMRGYALLRRILLELDRRHNLAGGIFYLVPDELPRLGSENLRETIASRKRRRSLALSLEMPSVLFSDDLDAIGRAIVPAGGTTLQGVPLSAGVAEAEALVLTEPPDEVPTEPYVLVCPSTDPAWVPLFASAVALVMETGGVLSHGAIVAREFGLPAVAGLPGVTRRLRTGHRVKVDGATGLVTVQEPGK